MINCFKNSYGEFDRDSVIGPVVWPYFDLFVVHNGHVFLELLGRRQIRLAGADAILIYPDSSFQGYSLSSLSRVSVHHFAPGKECESPAIRGLINKKRGFKIYRDCLRYEVENDIDRAVRLANEKRSKLDEQIRSLLVAMIVCKIQKARLNSPAATQKKNSRPEIREIIEWLNENPHGNITLKDMAERAGLSASYFRFLFRNETGFSPGSYFLRLKINKAAQMLRETVLPIKKIAMLCGYDDVAHFYRAFRPYYGVSPASYRREKRLLG